MRIVTYARVSTLGQETKGQSLQNQESAFAGYERRTGSHRIRAYREAASAGTVAGRAEFQRLLRELTETKPDAIVVDTLDRFTRNLREGLNLLEQLRGHGVGLLPLDWQRAQPINLDEDRDWQDVVEEFTAAERERRRIRRRVNRNYEGRRERGAWTGNKAPFGLVKRGDLLAPDPDTAWIVNEADTRVLAGESYVDVLKWASGVNPRAWRTRPGLRRALSNEWYVRAGVRTIETHKALARHLELTSARHGQRRQFEHEFTGVFMCGACADAGYPPDACLMSGNADPRAGYWNLVCARRNAKPLPAFRKDASHVEGRRHAFKVSAEKVRPFWTALIDEFTNPDALATLLRNAETKVADRTRALHRQLSDLEERAARLQLRRNAAFDMLAAGGAAARRQTEKQLEAIDAEEMALELQRQSVVAELAREPETQSAQRLGEALRAYSAIYENESARSRNELNRALCAAIGSHPRVYRDGPASRWSPVRVSWPEIERFRAPATAQPGRRS